MHQRKTLLTTIALSVLFAAPALAQQTTTQQPAPTAGPGRTAPPPSAATATAANMPTSTSTPSADTGHAALNGTLQKSHDEWRASKLVGQTVYDENGQTIGTVDDLMLDDAGKVSQAVISVGGFLGIGSKLVAVPYDQLKFEPNGNSPGTTGSATTTGAMTTGAAANGANGAATTGPEQTSSNPVLNPSGSAGTAQRPNYFSVVMPSANKNTLTSMNEFRYAT